MKRLFQRLSGILDVVSTEVTCTKIRKNNYSSDTSQNAVASKDGSKSEVPLMLTRRLKEPVPSNREPRQAWLESLRTIEDEKLGIVDLHPSVFGTNPRIDLIYENLYWQGLYRVVDYRSITTRSELPYRSNRKPWPQKKTGRARHGNRRSPIFLGGAQSKGPRGPLAHFFILPDHTRLHGLLSSLTVRYAQDDFHIVDSFDSLPSDRPNYLEQLVRERCWGDTVLFVNESDTAPANIAMACQAVPYYNIMPLYGLNVWSIMKHDTIVFSLPALEILEEKLLFHLRKTNTRTLKNPPWNESINNYYTGSQYDEFDPDLQ